MEKAFYRITVLANRVMRLLERPVEITVYAIFMLCAPAVGGMLFFEIFIARHVYHWRPEAQSFLRNLVILWQVLICAAGAIFLLTFGETPR